MPARILLLVVVANAWTPLTGSAACDHSDANAEAWFNLSYDERASMFLDEHRDAAWADAQEARIRQEVESFRDPVASTNHVECRSTLCKIELDWPRETFRGVLGQQVSSLFALGLDHQGETPTRVEEGKLRLEMILRSRERWTPTNPTVDSP